MKKRGASIFTKLAVLALVIYAAFNLVGLHGQIEDKRAALADLEAVVAGQVLENAVLAYELENRYHPEIIERIARGRLGLVLPGERVFYSIAN